MELSDYIIIVLVFITIYLLYNNYIEKFEVTDSIPLPQKINNVFKVDMSGIRNLNPIITALNGTNNIILNKYGVSELIINNSEFINTSSIQNLNLTGDLYISDYTNVNLCPRGVVIAWANINIPNGWVVCDGSTWWISKLPNVQDTNVDPKNSNYDKIIVPDLRGKFILNTFEYTNAYEYGGEEGVVLRFTDMPEHKHYNSKMLVNDDWGINTFDEYKSLTRGNNPDNYPVRNTNKTPYFEISYDSHSEESDDENMLPAMYIFPDNPYNSFKNTNTQQVYTSTGDLNMKVQYQDENKPHGDMPHDNMPPYYSLIYIMKK